MTATSAPLPGRSLAAQYLTPALAERLKERNSPGGFGLESLVASARANPDSSVGLYAPEPEAYQTFAELFEPVILDYHGLSRLAPQRTDWNAAALPSGELGRGLVRSSRARVARNLQGFALGAGITREARLEAEARIVAALQRLTGDLAGTYFPLGGLSRAQAERLRAEHLLFQKGDRFLEAAGLNRDWPEGRGIFLNEQKTFVVWVNEEDMLRIISMQPGGDLGQVFARLGRAVAALEQSLDFAFDQRLGWLTSCPSNLGTGLRASVHLKLERLGADPKRLAQRAEGLRLQVRGVHGEHSASVGGVYDLSNKERLGLSEAEAMHLLAEGLNALAAEETP